MAFIDLWSVTSPYTFLLQKKVKKCPEWLSIIWKGKMVEINSKGKIREETKKTKQASRSN